MATIYDFKALRNNGQELDFAEFKGKVLMIVNTASKCGFTPQYKGLEALYQKYIAQFCEINFGVTFPLMKTIEVNGKDVEFHQVPHQPGRQPHPAFCPRGYARVAR